MAVVAVMLLLILSNTPVPSDGTSPTSVSSSDKGGPTEVMMKAPTSAGQPHAPVNGAVEVNTKLIGDDDNEYEGQENSPTVATPPSSPTNNYTLAGTPAPLTPVVKPVAATTAVSVVMLF